MTNKADKKNNEKKIDTTGHSWDGISEYNIGAPRWWLIVWVICIIWAFIYWVYYPTWPSQEGNTKGSLEWTQHKALKDSQLEIELRKKDNLEKISKLSPKEIQKDPALLEFALQGGKIAFKENCAACHGTGAQGGVGFPNLNDDDWLWGGKLEDIYTTLMYGIRSGHEKARENAMPAFGLDKVLTREEVEHTANYVMSLSNKDIFKDKIGKKIFSQNCVACHGKKGQGNQKLGAPNLTDKIWLYGGKKEDIIHTITYSRSGVMPFWSSRLTNEQIKQLTLYVHSLGGGE